MTNFAANLAERLIEAAIYSETAQGVYVAPARHELALATDAVVAAIEDARKIPAPSGLHILEPESRGSGPILVSDADMNDIAEFFHNEHATVCQSYESAMMLAQALVSFTEITMPNLDDRALLRECLKSIAGMPVNEPRQDDDADWRFRCLEAIDVAKRVLSLPSAQSGSAAK